MFLTAKDVGIMLVCLLVFESGAFAQVPKLKVLEENTIWTNDQPVLRSRHAYFPFAAQFGDATILAAYQVGEAFESVDGSTRISRSRDMGKTWEHLSPFYDKSELVPKRSDSLKPTSLGNGKVILFGYEFFRENEDVPIGNPESGGLLDDRMILFRSNDNAVNWTGPEEIPCRWGHHVEASAPILILPNGDWVTPITEFADWQGRRSEESCGRLLRSSDQGKTWNDDTITMKIGPDVSVFEQRVCRLQKSGKLVVIAWNEDLKTGERFNNHYAVSSDNGKTFAPARDTGIRGQASSVCSLDEDRLFALHARRRDTDRPGIYGYIVNLENDDWKIEEELLVWEPKTVLMRDNSMAEVFAFLKFGQPGAIRLADGSLLITFWTIENGQGRTVAVKVSCQ